MQGSFVDAKEKFSFKKKDYDAKKRHKENKAWREKRQQKHAEN